MNKRCDEQVYSGRRDDYSGHRCRNMAVIGTKCRIHSQEAKNKRAADYQQRYEKKMANSPHRKLTEANERIRELEAEIALLEKQNNAMRDNPNNAALAEHILAADVLMKRNSELEAKLKRLEKAARAVIDYRLPAPEWEFAMLSLYKALDGEQGEV